MQKNKVKLSILVPSFNREKYIEETINSILLQETNFDFNIIITDDASTDRTLEIALDYQKKYPEKIIVLPSEQNNRLLVNIIKAYREMNCEYFCVLDPDDYYVDNKFLQKAIDFLENNKEFNVYAANTNILYPDGRYVAQNKNTSHISNFQDMLDECAILGNTISSVFRNVAINEELILKIEKYVGDAYSEHSVREDDFRNIIHLHNSKAYYINDIVGVYRITDTGIFQGSNKLKQILMKARAYTDMYYFFDKKYPQFIDLAVKNLYRIIYQADCSDLNTLLTFPTCEVSQFFKIVSLLYEADNSCLDEFLNELKTNKKNDSWFALFNNKIFSIKDVYLSRTCYQKIIKFLGIKFSKTCPNKYIQNKINNAKYIHFMLNDKFNKPFVDFLNKNFDKNEHLILCKKIYNHPMPKGDNVIEITSIKGLNFNKPKKIICHALFDGEVINYLYKHKNILKNKAYWVIWGGDLYGAPRDQKNDYLRKNFKGYVSLVPGDEIFAKNKYNSSPEVYFAPYVFPINEKILNGVNSIKKDFIKIQINNSCDGSTLEMFDVLSKFKNENIKITTVLSYGDMQFKDEIIKKGYEIFGLKFEYLENYMPADKYVHYLAQNDILILNQNRQQGVGNTIASAFLGAKIYIKEKISTNKFLNSIGVKIYNTEDISLNSFEEFIKYEYKDKTIIAAKEYCSENYIVNKWKDFFYESNDIHIKK